MRILFIGGTVFLGKAAVASAVERGHEVTLFNRGRSGPQTHPRVETIIGDRDGGLEPLRGREWDAVIDTCGYVPRVVRASAEMELAPVYMFISSISVYAKMDAPGTDEDAPVGVLADPDTERVDAQTYGPLKAACEQVVRDLYGRSALVIRPGLIVGPDDPTDRFTYWPRRAHEGGRMIAPSPPERQVQFIDVRDLASWMVTMCERSAAGTYNAVGPYPAIGMGDLWEACLKVAPPDTEVVWVSDEHLLNEQVGPWMELPLWIPASAEGMSGMQAADVSKAVAAGLTFRPVADTVVDTLEWDRRRGFPPLKAGLARQKEEQVLASWGRDIG